MNIDERQAAHIVQTIAGEHTLAPAAAEAIIEVAWIAVDADQDEEPEELAALDAIAAAVRKKAGVAAGPVVHDAEIPTDDEALERRLEQLMASLPDKWSRELAYVFAHILAIADFQISPNEDGFLVIARDTFGIEDDRAAELTTKVVEGLQPE
jgi:hypothetical protein